MISLMAQNQPHLDFRQRSNLMNQQISMKLSSYFASSAGTSGLSRVAIFSANDIGSNVWKLDEPLNSMVNGSYEYYLNFAYKSGGNGSDFNGLSSKPSDGKRWSNLISAFAAQDAGFLSQADPVVTFSNSKADTENPYFSHYLSLTDSSQRYDLAEEAVQITGNDWRRKYPYHRQAKGCLQREDQLCK